VVGVVAHDLSGIGADLGCSGSGYLLHSRPDGRTS
jgi:hypothetical protein